jgi:hypothetical protein
MHGLSTGRLLAVDVRPRRLGYATLEAPTRLLDSGVASYVSAKESTAKLESLVNRFHSRILVLRSISKGSRSNCARTRAIIRRLNRQLRRSSVRNVFVSDCRLRQHFQSAGTMTTSVITSKAANRYHFKTGQRKVPGLRCSTLSIPVQASLICDGLNFIMRASSDEPPM